MFEIGDIVFNSRRNFHGIVTWVDYSDDTCQIFILEKGKSGYWCAFTHLEKVSDV